MVSIRIDPWTPQYGADVEALLGMEEPAEASVQVDPTVERRDWSQPIACSPVSDVHPLVFVDGVRRVECRVLAEEDDRRAWGLLGSYGVGAVLADGKAAWLEHEVQRLIVTGSGMTSDGVSVLAGHLELAFWPMSVIGGDPLDPLHGLQKAMRDAEARLAGRVAGRGWVLADGPLIYPFGPEQRVVGIVKRMVAAYLPPEQAALLPRLAPSQRTPLFALGHQALDRYAWYQRLVPLRSHWHSLAGLIRAEVRMEAGVEAAQQVADVLGAELPAYAGRLGFDPRAPQNLTPVGALETRLRHLLGDAAFIRRRIELALGAGHAVATTR